METDKAKRTQVREAVRFHRQYAGSEGSEYTQRADIPGRGRFAVQCPRCGDPSGIDPTGATGFEKRPGIGTVVFHTT